MMTTKLDGIRSAFGIIGRTDSGNVLAHLCKTLRIALRAQARLFPIFDGRTYEGSIVSGSKFTIAINGLRLDIMHPASRSQTVWFFS